MQIRREVYQTATGAGVARRCGGLTHVNDTVLTTRRLRLRTMRRAKKVFMTGWKKRQGLGWTIAAISGLLMVSTDPDLMGAVIYGFLIAIGIMLALGPSWGQ